MNDPKKPRKGRKISPELEKEILALAAKGKSSRAIAAWLQAERGVTTAFQNVAALLRHTRVERGDVAKAVVREALVDHVTSDLDILSAEQARVERLAARLYKAAHAAVDDIEANVDARAEQDAPSASHRAASGDPSLDRAKTFSDLALKASDRVDKLAARKLHYAGADEGSGAAVDGEVTVADAARAMREIFTGGAAGPGDESSA